MDRRTPHNTEGRPPCHESSRSDGPNDVRASGPPVRPTRRESSRWRGALLANLLINGGFEQPVVLAGAFFRTLGVGIAELTGWTIAAGNLDVVNNQPSAEGTQSLDLNGTNPAVLRQEFATTPGARYRLSFAYANNPRGLITNPSALVQVIGTAVQEDGTVTAALGSIGDNPGGGDRGREAHGRRVPQRRCPSQRRPHRHQPGQRCRGGRNARQRPRPRVGPRADAPPESRTAGVSRVRTRPPVPVPAWFRPR